jgi:hypothetical protein
MRTGASQIAQTSPTLSAPARFLGRSGDTVSLGALAGFMARSGTVSLGEVKARAGLLDRLDTKYIVPLEVLYGLFPDLAAHFAVLRIDDALVFGYDTVYFDTADLATYRAHLQKRRKRFKVRSRHYVDTGHSAFEVKLKGPRGQTVKKQMAYDDAQHGSVSEPARAFLGRCLRRAYGQDFRHDLTPTLRMHYSRMTLVAQAGAERVTCDAALSFLGPAGPAGRLASGHVLIETKSERGNGVADRLLRAAGARAVDCSKYCVGIALSRPDMKHNELKWLLARYFDWSSPLATAGDGAEAQPAARANVAALGPDGRLRLQPVRLPG